jgi:8-oxo-dGTP pyrophosphatase MutT (NUDIX family)
VTDLRLDPEWLRQLQQRADAAPLLPRVPLWWRSVQIGSVEAKVLAALRLPGLLQPSAGGGCELGGPLSASLAALAQALRERGFVRAWRDEQLAVCDAVGTPLGSVERGAARLLGIATHAVHLIGLTGQGSHWVQQRALDKADDPGLWDTLVGGMVAAGEDAESTLLRECEEEAGLALQQLRDVRLGGQVASRRPCASTPGGYIVERIDWYLGTVPQSLVPQNRDGEVAQFELLTVAELRERLQASGFTIDAGRIFSDFCARGHDLAPD